jgi:hypothetical protein
MKTMFFGVFFFGGKIELMNNYEWEGDKSENIEE